MSQRFVLPAVVGRGLVGFFAAAPRLAPAFVLAALWQAPLPTQAATASQAAVSAPGAPAQPAMAQLPAAQPTAAGGVLACRGIADDTARLACFDRESAWLAQSGAALSPGVAAAEGSAARAASAPSGADSPNSPGHRATTATASLDPQQSFGLSTAEISAREVAAGERPREAASITAHIARLYTGANGRVVFTLDNHQVWQELLAAGDLDSQPGESVVISRGMLGSYWMKAQSGRGAKVTRLH